MLQKNGNIWSNQIMYITLIVRNYNNIININNTIVHTNNIKN